jgi:hypothetical protein
MLVFPLSSTKIRRRIIHELRRFGKGLLLSCQLSEKNIKGLPYIASPYLGLRKKENTLILQA